jgi:Putative lumazine-binding
MTINIQNASTNTNNDDTQQIEATALDYTLGWYEGDAARMKRALHPELVKRMFNRDALDAVVLDQMGALELLNRAEKRKGLGYSQGRADVTVLDVFQSVATARVDAETWIDYLQLARVSGSWKIVNVLWELRQSQIASQ